MHSESAHDRILTGEANDASFYLEEGFDRG